MLHQQTGLRRYAQQILVVTAAMLTIHRVSFRLLLHRGLTGDLQLQTINTLLTTLLLLHLARPPQHNHLYLILQRTTDL
jgi:hypothetical protein